MGNQTWKKTNITETEPEDLIEMKKWLREDGPLPVLSRNDDFLGAFITAVITTDPEWDDVFCPLTAERPPSKKQPLKSGPRRKA